MSGSRGDGAHVDLIVSGQATIVGKVDRGQGRVGLETVKLSFLGEKITMVWSKMGLCHWASIAAGDEMDLACDIYSRSYTKIRSWESCSKMFKLIEPTEERSQ